jgi:hypothetical protein
MGSEIKGGEKMVQNKKARNIDSLKRKFKKEWLLIKPTKIDKLSGPLAGILLAHSKSKEEIYHFAKKIKEHIYITFSEDTLPKGYAVAFYVKIRI